MYSRKQHNIAKQLYSNFLKKLPKQTPGSETIQSKTFTSTVVEQSEHIIT